MMKKTKAIQYSKLLVGIIVMYLLAVVVLKRVNNSGLSAQVQNIVKEKNLNPSAFFYSDEIVIDSIEVDVTIR